MEWLRFWEAYGVISLRVSFCPFSGWCSNQLDNY